MKSVKTCNVICRPGKSNLTIADNLERALAVEGLTDDVKRIGDGAREFDSRSEEEEESKIAAGRWVTITIIWPSPSRQ